MLREAPVMLIRNTIRQFLLLRFAETHPKFPGQWGLPGGKRELIKSHQEFVKQNYAPVKGWEYDESREECIYREVLEEIGVKVGAFRYLAYAMMDSHYMMPVFHAVSEHIEVKKEFPNREHSEYGWFEVDELPENTSSVTRELLENF
jgi:NADH pyrophosphatase NudC (nudix superfamily)